MLSHSDSHLLSWTDQDRKVHHQASCLGAPLEAGENLYPDLQEYYMDDKQSSWHNALLYLCISYLCVLWYLLFCKVKVSVMLIFTASLYLWNRLDPDLPSSITWWGGSRVYILASGGTLIHGDTVMHVRTRLIEKHKEVEKWICKRLMISMCQGRVETIAACLDPRPSRFICVLLYPSRVYSIYMYSSQHTKHKHN